MKNLVKEFNMNNIKNNQSDVVAVGYDKQDIEAVIRLLNNIPVKDVIETQSKYQIYEVLMKPKYEFQPPIDNEQ